MVKVQGTLTIRTKNCGASLGDMFGIFFEDLNHAADGGLYAELVQNRSFEFAPIDNSNYHELTAWEKVERNGGKCEIRVETETPLNANNQHYAVIDIQEAGDGVGLMNYGFNSGIPLREGETYLFSVYARRNNSFEAPVTVTLEGTDGKVNAESVFVVESDEWTKYEARLTATATDYNGRLTLTTKGSGLLYVDMISLFPSNTFRNRPNGLREDIATMLADLKPKFMRFPGGCLIHDGSLHAGDRDSMYRWKNTLGHVEERPARRNNWNYNQTLGLGYYEYFLFCEDIGAKPIPVVPGGYNPHHKRAVPIDELQPWIDDALDLIEFANGDVTTEWGAIRAELGHPEPFGLEYIGVGNEEVGEPFFERYTHFHRAIKERYPEIRIINTSGPFAYGEEYERGWRSARENGSDYVDEHYYQSPEWMIANHRRYDGFKSDDPKVFVGEYASRDNTYFNALAEAAFMTGFERNAHAVGLACYAPLLCNVDYVNWQPNLIWFNNHQVFGTANYYVQKLFMHHQGDYTLPVQADGFEQPAKGECRRIAGKIALGTEGGAVEYSQVKLTNHVTGEIKHLLEGTILATDTEEDRAAGQARRLIELDSIDCEHYSLSLNATRKAWGRGIMVHFGRMDDTREMLWRIGGWNNNDSVLNSTMNGRISIIDHCLFDLENDVEHELLLEVKGRKIRAFIDGVQVIDTEDQPFEIEPLYYSSTFEEATGDIIVKIVNVQDAKVSTGIVLDGFDEDAPIVVDIAELTGYSVDEMNSFEEPERIVPVNRTLQMKGHTFEYEIQRQSVTIMRVKKSINC